MFVLVTTIIHDQNWINFIPKFNFSFNFNYFQNVWQNIAISIYTALSVLFLIFQMLSFSTKLSVLHAGFKKIIISFVIGLIIFILSNQKSNAVLVFTFAPMAVMSTNFFENTETPWVKEVSAVLISTLALICFVGQL
jgi:DNA integrity scanning protein DisA with diadenylate cyclase activity